LPLERKKAKDAAPTGAIRKIRLFCQHLKGKLIMEQQKKEAKFGFFFYFFL